MTQFVRAAQPGDNVAGWAASRWGEPTMVVHDTVYDLRTLPALLARGPAGVIGVLTYHVEGPDLEIVSCDADPPGRGTGSLLVGGAMREAHVAGCRRVVCTTTNDNLAALGFWQAIGFRLVALRPDSVAAARARKPSIPLTGHRGLPIRDELDLEFTF